MKQWMKKSLAACLALVMCLTLAACGGKEGETPAEESCRWRSDRDGACIVLQQFGSTSGGG